MEEFLVVVYIVAAIVGFVYFIILCHSVYKIRKLMEKGYEQFIYKKIMGDDD